MDGQDDGVILLGALRDLFGDEHTLASKVACEKLNADDELPFGARRGGQGIDPRGLGRLLRPYSVKPRNVRAGGEVLRGYHRDQLTEPWARYLDGGDTRVADPAHEALQALHPLHPAPHAACDVADVADVADEVQALPHACVDGNGAAPQALLDVLGSEGAVVDVLARAFDAVEVEVDHLTERERAERYVTP